MNLPIIEQVLGGLGASEMRDEQREPMILCLQARSDRGNFIGCDTQTIHAGIDVNGRSSTPLRRRAECVPFGQFIDAANHRACTELGKCRSAVAEKTIE